MMYMSGTLCPLPRAGDAALLRQRIQRDTKHGKMILTYGPGTPT